MDSTPRETSTGHSSPPNVEELTAQTARTIIIPYILGYVARTAPLPEGREVIVIVNARTRSMTMIEGGVESEMFIGGKLGQSPASKASIEAMPIVKVEEEGKECAICLAEFDVGGEAKEMPCKHMYHQACIEKWLGMRGSCPLCRYSMPVEENKMEGENYTVGDDGVAENEGRGEGERVVEEEGDGRGPLFVFRVYYAGRRVRRRHRYSETETDPAWNSSLGGETDGENSGSSAQDEEIDNQVATQDIVTDESSS